MIEPPTFRKQVVNICTSFLSGLYKNITKSNSICKFQIPEWNRPSNISHMIAVVEEPSDSGHCPNNLSKQQCFQKLT